MSDPWDDVLVTHREAVNRLPTSIRSDFQPPSPFDAVKGLGISFADLVTPKVEFSAGGIAKPMFLPSAHP